MLEAAIDVPHSAPPAKDWKAERLAAERKIVAWSEGWHATRPTMAQIREIARATADAIDEAMDGEWSRGKCGDCLDAQRLRDAQATCGGMLAATWNTLPWIKHMYAAYGGTSEKLQVTWWIAREFQDVMLGAIARRVDSVGPD